MFPLGSKAKFIALLNSNEILACFFLLHKSMDLHDERINPILFTIVSVPFYFIRLSAHYAGNVIREEINFGIRSCK